MKQFHFLKEHGFMIGVAAFATLFLFAGIMLFGQLCQVAVFYKYKC